MKTLDPRSDLQDGFEPAPAPPIGPDGAPIIAAQQADPPARPSLCLAGPCRNYHQLVTQVDAANPSAVRLPVVLPDGTPGAEVTLHGTLYRAPAVFHVQTNHYCYPNVGIEIDLGSVPVVECSRWSPLLATEWQPRETDRAVFRASPAGVAFQRQLDDWARARAAAEEGAEEAARLIEAMAMSASKVACQACARLFDAAELDEQMTCRDCQGRWKLAPKTTQESP